MMDKKILKYSWILVFLFNMSQLYCASYAITVHNKTDENLKIDVNYVSWKNEKTPYLKGEIAKPGQSVSTAADIDYLLEVTAKNMVQEKFHIYTKALGENQAQLSIEIEELKQWIDSKKLKPNEIGIYLRKRKKDPKVLEALTPAEFKMIELRAKQALLPKANLEAILDIKPGTIRKQIFDLAKESNYSEIEKLLGTIDDLKGLKELINFQYDIALILANQVDFEAHESHASLRFPEQTIINIDPEEVTKRIKIQLLYVILRSKEEKEINSYFGLNDPLSLIHDFLVGLGYLPEEFIEVQNIEETQKTIARNFKELFERFFMVMKVEPRLLPQLEMLKKAMKL